MIVLEFLFLKQLSALTTREVSNSSVYEKTDYFSVLQLITAIAHAFKILLYFFLNLIKIFYRLYSIL